MQGMPLVRTAVTAGDHIDWMTVSPEAIRLTLSLKSFQNARNSPAFLASVRTPIVMSISALVMLPLSGYLYLPVDSTTIAASMMPIEGMLRMAALPLNSGLSNSAHELIGRLIRSGRMPSVSALYTVGIRVTHSVGVAENLVECSPSRNITFLGAVPWSPITLPFGNWPLVKTGVMLSNSLIFLASIARMLPDGTSFLRLKYSVSRTSNEFGWVMTRLVTSSVVATMFWMVIPVSAFTFLVMSSDWLTAVPRYRRIFSSCAQIAGKPVIAPEPAAAPARPAAPLSTARRDRPFGVLTYFFDIRSLLLFALKASRCRGERVDVLVGPDYANAVADVQGLLGELFVAHQGRKLGNAWMVQGDLIM